MIKALLISAALAITPPGAAIAVEVGSASGTRDALTQGSADGLYLNDDTNEVMTGNLDVNAQLKVSSKPFIVDGTGSSVLVGHSGTALYVNTNLGRVGVGTTNPGTALHVASGTLTIDGTGRVQIGAAGTSLFMNAAIGNLGLGTVSPGGLLHVTSGTVIVDGAGSGLRIGSLGTGLYFDTNTGRVAFGSVNPGVKMLLSSGAFVNDGSGASVTSASMTLTGTADYAATLSTGMSIGGGGALKLYGGGSIVFPDGTTQTSAASGAGWTDDGTVVRLTTPGDNVGVGTTLPGTKLHVSSQTLTVDGNGSEIRAGASGTALYANTNTSRVGFGTTNPATFLHGSSGTLTLDGAGSQIRAGSLGTGLFFDTNIGRAGFGTVSPGTKLHVSSGGLTVDGDTANLTVQSGAAVNLLRVSTTVTAGTASVFVESDGQVGVGHTSPSAALDVQTGGGAVPLRVSTTSTAGSPAVYVNATGRVGIGTSNPTHRLSLGIDGQETGEGFCIFNRKSGTCADGNTESLRLDARSVNGVPEMDFLGASRKTITFRTLAGNGETQINAKIGLMGIGKFYDDPTATAEIGSTAPADKWVLQVSSQNRVDLLNVHAGTGFVGVGAASPGTKLHMSSGALTVDGSAAAIKLGDTTNSGALTLSSGTAVKAVFMGSFTKDCANVAAQTVFQCSAVTTEAINPGDVCYIDAPSLEANLSVSVSSASSSVLAFRLTNPTAGGIDPASQAFNYTCWRKN